MAKKRFYVAIRVITADGPRFVVRRWDTYHHTVPYVMSTGEAASIARVSKTAMVNFLTAGFAGLEPDALDISAWMAERVRADNKRRRKKR